MTNKQICKATCTWDELDSSDLSLQSKQTQRPSTEMRWGRGSGSSSNWWKHSGDYCPPFCLLNTCWSPRFRHKKMGSNTFLADKAAFQFFFFCSSSQYKTLLNSVLTDKRDEICHAWFIVRPNCLCLAGGLICSGTRRTKDKCKPEAAESICRANTQMKDVFCKWNCAKILPWSWEGGGGGGGGVFMAFLPYPVLFIAPPPTIPPPLLSLKCLICTSVHAQLCVSTRAHQISHGQRWRAWRPCCASPLVTHDHRFNWAPLKEQ